MTTTTEALNAYNTLKQANGYNASKARLFVILNDGDIHVVSQHLDVYQALDDAPEVLASMSDIRFIGVDTCGWAAPLTDGEPEVPPSAHPSRRRCRLVCVVDRNLDSASCIGFEDDPENLVTDSGKATGSLADAVANAMGALIYLQATKN
jgi:hypothetical protein